MFSMVWRALRYLGSDQMDGHEYDPIRNPLYSVTSSIHHLHKRHFSYDTINQEKVKVHPSLYVLMIQLLARGERYAELSLLVINKVSQYVFCTVRLCGNANSLYAAYVDLNLTVETFIVTDS